MAIICSADIIRSRHMQPSKYTKSVSPDVISIHAFHVHLNDSRVHFDVVVDFSLTDYAAFRKNASKALTEAFPTYSFQFNIDPDYA